MYLFLSISIYFCLSMCIYIYIHTYIMSYIFDPTDFESSPVRFKDVGKMWQSSPEAHRNASGAHEVIKVRLHSNSAVANKTWHWETMVCRSQEPLKAISTASCGLEVVPDDSSSGECSPEQTPQEVAVFLPIAEVIDLRCPNGGACRLCTNFPLFWGGSR